MARKQADTANIAAIANSIPKARTHIVAPVLLAAPRLKGRQGQDRPWQFDHYCSAGNQHQLPK